MCGKENDIFKKTISLKNNYKNNLNDINDGFNISLISILSNFIMYLLIPPSPLSEKNLVYKLISRIALSSFMRARITRVKKIY